MSSPLRLKFNPAAGWIIVRHETPERVIVHDKILLLVPPGLAQIYQQFYGASVTVIENQRLPE